MAIMFALPDHMIDGFKAWVKAFGTTRYEDTGYTMYSLCSRLTSTFNDNGHPELRSAIYHQDEYELYATFFQAITLEEFLALKACVEEIPVPYSHYGYTIRV